MEEKINLKQYIEDFIKGNIKDSRFEEFNEYSVSKSLETEDESEQYIYNEMSLQHELGEYLRKILNGTCKKNNQEKARFMVQYERNITSFTEFNGKNNSNLRKREMDITIIDNEKNENYLIELKYHKKERKRYPNTMFDCVKDIDFVYNVVNEENSKFVKGYCITVVEDSTFYETSSIECDDKLYTNYWCFRKLKDRKNNFSVKKSESIEKTKPIDIKKYVEKQYLPVREYIDGKITGTTWKKVFDENDTNNVNNKEVNNEDAKNARYYIIEIEKDKK